MSSKAVREKERQEAIETLRGWLPPGSTVYCVLRSVSRSGMSRSISLHYIENGEPRWISYLAAKAAGLSYDDKREAVKMGGCGMDMGFAAVYELSYALYPEGFGCTGEKCLSSDHSNGDRDYTPWNLERQQGHWHNDGGCALRHRWL